MCFKHCNKKAHKDFDKRLAKADDAIEAAVRRADALSIENEIHVDRIGEVERILRGTKEQLRECREGQGETPPLPPPANPIEITRDQVIGLIDEMHRPVLRYLDDNLYWMPTVDEYKAVVMYLAVYKYEYVAEKFDCNKFTRALGALTSLQPGWEGTPCFDVQYEHPIMSYHSEMLTVLMDSGIPKLYIVEGQEEVNGVSFREANWQFAGVVKPWIIKQ